MAHEIGEDLVAYCRSELGERVRAVTYYSADDHDPLYTRPDIPDEIQLDEETRTMFRTPLIQLQKAVQQLASVHPTIDDPAFAFYSYGEVSVIQLPITREEGLIVSIDSGSQFPTDFESQCNSILARLTESTMH